MIDEDTLAEILASKSEAELKGIIDEAWSVAAGHTTSISSLSSSTTFDKAGANQVLTAAHRALKIRRGGADAPDPISLRPVQGHEMRLSSMILSGP